MARALSSEGGSLIGRVLNHDWVKVGAVIVALVSLVVAAEHRVTVVEERQTELARIVAGLQLEMKNFQDAQVVIQANQVRVVTILEQIDRRHQTEDAARPARAR